MVAPGPTVRISHDETATQEVFGKHWVDPPKCPKGAPCIRGHEEDFRTRQAMARAWAEQSFVVDAHGITAVTYQAPSLWMAEGR